MIYPIYFHVQNSVYFPQKLCSFSQKVINPTYLGRYRDWFNKNLTRSKNDLTIKSLQFLSHHYQTWSYWRTHEVILLTKFCDNSSKIEDFLLLVNVWSSPRFFISLYCPLILDKELHLLLGYSSVVQCNLCIVATFKLTFELTFKEKERKGPCVKKVIWFFNCFWGKNLKIFGMLIFHSIFKSFIVSCTKIFSFQYWYFFWAIS